MTTIAGSALDLDLLGTKTTENSNSKNNASSSSRPSSRLAKHASDDRQQQQNAGENKDENKNKNSISSSSLEKQIDQKTFFFRCQKCRTPLEVERITGDDDGDHAKFIAETSGKLKVTVGEKQFRDFLLDEDAEETARGMSREEDFITGDGNGEDALERNSLASSSYVHLPTSVQRTKTSDALKAAGKTAATLSRIFDIASEKTKHDWKNSNSSSNMRWRRIKR
jgi:hypothetical protein